MNKAFLHRVAVLVLCVCCWFTADAEDLSDCNLTADCSDCSHAEYADSVAPDTVKLSERAKLVFTEVEPDTAGVDSLTAALNSFEGQKAKVKIPKIWKPNPKKAMWLAIAFPGAGQIYNRKYWKLPIIYGGFVGCIYALKWNNTMYRDYSQAYIDIMDDDPNTSSFMNFIPSGYDVDSNVERLQKLFQNKKNYYRRYRDLSIFIFIGVYALSIIDAYVDAEMSSFDISRDLSMKVRPSVINSRTGGQAPNTGFAANAYGVRCSLYF